MNEDLISRLIDANALVPEEVITEQRRGKNNERIYENDR